MGVVHKLKQEIIDFIVQQKASTPHLSCRQISTLIEDQFSKKVSKSSVNAVLKDLNLSSTVGRRGGETKKAKKFTIPEETKNKLFESLPTDSPVPQETIPQSEGDAIKCVSEEVLFQPLNDEPKGEGLTLLPDPVVQIPAEIVSEPVVPLPQELDAQEVEKEIGRYKQSWENNCRKIKGAGAIIVKALQWEYFSAQFIAERLMVHYQNLCPAQMAELCDTYVSQSLLQKFKVDIVAAGKDHLIWALRDQPGIVLSPQEIELVKRFPLTNELKAELLNKFRQNIIDAGSVKINLTEGRQVGLDAHMGSIVNLANYHGPAVAFESLMVSVAKRLISNNLPVIFRHWPQPENAEDFRELIFAFEGLPGKAIEKITVAEPSGSDLVSFSLLPKKRRNYIIGVSQVSALFESLTKALKWAGKELYYHQGYNQVLYFSEVKTDLLSTVFPGVKQKGRIVAVWRDPVKEPILALISNDLESSALSILSSYVRHWPALEQEEVLALQPVQGEDNQAFFDNLVCGHLKVDSGSPQLGDVLEIICVALKHCIEKRIKQILPEDFVSLSNVMSSDIDGKLLSNERSVSLLIPSRQSEYVQLFKQLNLLLSQSQCLDLCGRKLFVNIEL